MVAAAGRSAAWPRSEGRVKRVETPTQRAACDRGHPAGAWGRGRLAPLALRLTLTRSDNAKPRRARKPAAAFDLAVTAGGVTAKTTVRATIRR